MWMRGTWGRFVSETIESVERGRAVTLCEGGVIEDVVHEKVDRALIGHDGLSDVNQFGRPRPAWQAASRPCSMEVAAKAGNPMTSPTA